MPCEEVSLREKMTGWLGHGKKTPLLLLRFGYSDPLPHSFRRDIDNIIVKE